MPDLRSTMIAAMAVLAFSVTGLGWAAGTKINGVNYEKPGGQVSREALVPEQALRLKKIFLFPSLDDVSGALAPKLDEKLASLFAKNSRYEVIREPQVIKALSPDESSYAKAAENQEVHREAARVTNADTTALLRTRNVGSLAEMTLQLRDSSGSLLFFESGTVPGSASMDARWGLIEKLFKNITARLPFEGAITGRTANTLTVDLGIGFLRQGEEIEIARIVSVQRHPLLGTVVSADYVRTGRARVSNVDRLLSFADVIEEFSGEKISPGQKVLLRRRVAVVRRADGRSDEGAEEGLNAGGAYGDASGSADAFAKTGETDEFEDRIKGDFDHPKPRFGQVGGTVAYGSLGHSQSYAGALGEYSGSGLGGDLNGELWVTKNWIFSLLYGFHGATLSGNGQSVGSASWHVLEGVVGYRIFPETIAEGVTITGGLGYQSMSFSIPGSTALKVGGKRYAGPLVRVDGEILFLRGQKITTGFAIQPFSSVTEEGPSLGTPNKGNMIGFHLGWNYQLNDLFWLRIGIRYDSANASYDNSSTVADKRFAIGPGIYYSF